jgi:branched-chain amino acid transport system permease protein
LLPAELIFIVDSLAIFSVYLIISISLNLEAGYTGVPNFGKVLVVAGGAFVAGFLPGRLMALLMGLDPGLGYVKDNARIVSLVTKEFEANVPMAITMFIITILVAMLVGAVLGFIASYPAIRLREDYLAIILLAMGEGIRIVGQNYFPLVGGTVGVSIPNPFACVGGYRLIVITFVMLTIALLTLFYAERLARSPLGRLLRAVRDCEIAASSLGKNISGIRTKVLIVGSALGAVGGALYAFYAASTIAVAYSRVSWTFWPWTIVTLGGLANNMGVAVGTMFFIVVRRLITFYKRPLEPLLPFDVVWLDLLLLGFALILILLYRPEGLIPEKPTFTIDPKKIGRLIEEAKSSSRE